MITTEAERQRRLDAYHATSHYKAMAKVLGLKHETVYWWLKRYGMKPKIGEKKRRTIQDITRKHSYETDPHDRELVGRFAGNLVRVADKYQGLTGGTPDNRQIGEFIDTWREIHAVERVGE